MREILFAELVYEGWKMGAKFNTCTVKRHICKCAWSGVSSLDRHQWWSVLRSTSTAPKQGSIGGGSRIPHRKLISQKRDQWKYSKGHGIRSSISYSVAVRKRIAKWCFLCRLRKCTLCVHPYTFTLTERSVETSYSASLYPFCWIDRTSCFPLPLLLQAGKCCSCLPIRFSPRLLIWVFRTHWNSNGIRFWGCFLGLLEVRYVFFFGNLNDTSQFQRKSA